VQRPRGNWHAAKPRLADDVQSAALKPRNLQKRHTKKPTKPTELTIRRPSVGQKKIGNTMPCTRPKARGSDADRSKLSTCFASMSRRSILSILCFELTTVSTIWGLCFLRRFSKVIHPRSPELIH